MPCGSKAQDQALWKLDHALIFWLGSLIAGFIWAFLVSLPPAREAAASEPT